MRNLKLLSILLFMACLFASCSKSEKVEKRRFDKVRIVKQEMHWLDLGTIKPQGWMLNQMKHDLEEGFVGYLDQLVPDLIIEDDIYGADRLTKKVKSKDVGTIGQDADWEVQYLWWNSETQSNWRDGLFHNAFLTGNQEYINKCHQITEQLLSYQDEDGYMGIYAPDLRYNFSGENGELWAQASLFRVLLAYYESTGKQSVLEAIEKAVAVTMKAYPIGDSKPFDVEKPYAGVGHGLMFTDVLDRLYHHTNKEIYLDYAVWLFEDYNKYELSEVDIHVDNLLDPKYKFKGHGVHTYEHLRSLLTSYYATGNEYLKKALSAYLIKLDSCLTPTGGPIGDEWVAERHADASLTGYEYCSIHELLDSYTHLLQKTGESQWGDRIEWILFNAAQAARHPHESSIAYCKTDNSSSMVGELQPDDNKKKDHPETRYKYSPAHQDVAVCCVPNAGRIFPYYVKAMWMKTDKGLAKTLYGASQLNDTINGIRVSVSEVSDYPFNLESRFSIEVSEPLEMELKLRKPGWATAYSINIPGEYIADEAGWITINKVWNGTESLEIKFEASTQKQTDLAGDVYFSNGPLAYALPLNGEEKSVKDFEINDFRNVMYESADNAEKWVYSGSEFRLVNSGASFGWGTSMYLEGTLYNKETTTEEQVRLVPIGNTILRQLTFEEIN